MRRRRAFPAFDISQELVSVWRAGESGDYPNSPPSSAVIILAIDIPESILPCIRLVTHLIRITAPQEQLRPLRRSLESNKVGEALSRRRSLLIVPSKSRLNCTDHVCQHELNVSARCLLAAGISSMKDDHAVVLPLVVRLAKCRRKSFEVLTANVSLSFLDCPPKVGMRVNIPHEARIADINKTFRCFSREIVGNRSCRGYCFSVNEYRQLLLSEYCSYS